MKFKNKSNVYYNWGSYKAPDFRGIVQDIACDGRYIVQVFYPGKAVPTIEYAYENQLKQRN